MAAKKDPARSARASLAAANVIPQVFIHGQVITALNRWRGEEREGEGVERKGNSLEKGNNPAAALMYSDTSYVIWKGTHTCMIVE